MIYIVQKEILATTRVGFLWRGDISMTKCVDVLFSLLSGRFGTRSIQNPVSKHLQKICMFCLYRLLDLGSWPTKIKPKHKSKFCFSTDVDVSERGVHICNTNKKSSKQKHTVQATFRSRDCFCFNHIYIIYIYIILYIYQSFSLSLFLSLCVSLSVCLSLSLYEALRVSPTNKNSTHALAFFRCWLLSRFDNFSSN
jgi:hypothetical protein